MKNFDKNICKYFKIGDIILDRKDSVWKNTQFVIQGFYNNAYLPLAHCKQLAMADQNKYKCNFDVRDIRLIGCLKRPFKEISKEKLLKMMKKGIIEAKREFFIRINTKTL